MHTGGSRGYCKLSDKQINAIAKTSKSKDAYISLSFKGPQDVYVSHLAGLAWHTRMRTAHPSHSLLPPTRVSTTVPRSPCSCNLEQPA